MLRYVNQYMNKLQNTENEEFIVVGDTDYVHKDSIIIYDEKTAEELFNKYKDKITITVIASNKDLNN